MIINMKKVTYSFLITSGLVFSRQHLEIPRKTKYVSWPENIKVTVCVLVTSPHPSLFWPHGSHLFWQLMDFLLNWFNSLTQLRTILIDADKRQLNGLIKRTMKKECARWAAEMYTAQGTALPYGQQQRCCTV